MSKIKVEDLGIKKTMLSVATLLVAANVPALIGDEKWDGIVAEMQPTARTSNGPREITILKDIDGNQLGRKCSVTGLFYTNDYFFKGTSVCKIADGEKTKNWTSAKKIEEEAKTFLETARNAEKAVDKIAAYESYDKKLLEAKAERQKEIPVTDEMKEGGFETIEELAKHLKVEVNPVKPETESAPDAE